MSLITGCPACGTMFRVVPDQLKISDGWVRCGHCQEVFDATAHLQAEVVPEAGADPVPPPAITPDPPAPQVAPPVALPPGVHVLPEPAPAHTVPAQEQPGDPDIEVIEVSTRWDDSDFPSSRAPLVPSSGGTSGFGYSPSRFDAEDSRSNAMVSVQPFVDSDVPENELRAPVTRRELEEVGFVRRARKKAFWRRPVVRLLLVLLALGLAALLAAQFGVQERDRLALQYPGLRPLLERLCEPLACRIEAPRRIDAVLIDNSGFTRVRGDTYRLSFTLKNQSMLPLAVPALQLTLTDTQDQALMQRVLLPNELGPAPPTLAPAGEWSSSVALAVSPAGGNRIAGYRLLAFYP